MRALPEIRAGVDLDGSLYDQALTTPLGRPFMLLARDGHSTASDPSWKRAWAELRGFRREIRLVGAGHEDFSDNAGFIAGLGLGDRFTHVEIGSIRPARATTATGEILTTFFDRFLGDQQGRNALLDRPSLVNPDLLRLR
jgi:hypothetical protein